MNEFIGSIPKEDSGPGLGVTRVNTTPAGGLSALSTPAPVVSPLATVSAASVDNPYLTANPDVAAADPVSDLYTQYAGRAADPEGVAYWRQQFGDTVDPSEAAIFQRAVADNVAKGVESTATATNYNPYFAANPDVAAEYLKNTQGMTPEQFANYHYQTYGQFEGRAAPTGVTTTTSSPLEGVNTSPDALAASTTTPVFDNPLNHLATVDNSQLAAGLSGGDTAIPGVQNTQALLSAQILASSDPTKWTGQGWGSAQKNADDMARILTGIGITDLKDFGQIPTYQNLEMRYTYNGQPVTQNPDGSFSAQVARGYNRDGETVFGSVTIPADQVQKQYGNTQTQYLGEGEEQTSFVPADSSKVITKDGQPVIQTGTTYGNTKTGQAVPSTYGERQTGNAWGGTFAGEGNTGYRVQYDAQGNPHFYTTYASSNSLMNLLADNPVLNVAANLAAAYFGGPAGVAALNAAEGKDVGDIAKSAALSYVGGEVAQGVTDYAGDALNTATGVEPGFDTFKAASGVGDVGGGLSQTAINNTAAKVLGSAAGNVVTSGGKTSFGDALLSGGIGAGVGAVTNQIPGYADLPASAKTFVTRAVTSAIQNGGNLSTADIEKAAIAAGTSAAKQGLADLRSPLSTNGSNVPVVDMGPTSYGNYQSPTASTGADAYVAAVNAGATPNEALNVANLVTGGTGDGGNGSANASGFDQLHTNIASVVPQDVQVASSGSGLPDSFRPVAANQIQVDANGLPKTIGIMDFNTGKVVPVPIQQDGGGRFYYNTPEGTTVGVDPSAFERAFYQSNPSEYLRIVNDIYANSGDINKINAELARRGFSPSMADSVHTIDVQARDVTGTAADKTGTGAGTTTDNTASGKSGTVSDTVSSVGDFLSKVNLRGALAGDVPEIAGAGSVPEVARQLSAAQDFGYVNDIKNYFDSATTTGDRQYYKSLAQELVNQKPELGDNQTIKDILAASDTALNLGDLGTITITGSRLPKDNIADIATDKVVTDALGTDGAGNTAINAAITSGIDPKTAVKVVTNNAVNNGTKVGVTTDVDKKAGTATTTTTNDSTNSVTTTTTDTKSGTNITTNVNGDTNVSTNTVTDSKTGITTKTVTDNSTGAKVTLTLDKDGKVVNTTTTDSTVKVLDGTKVVIGGKTILIADGSIVPPGSTTTTTTGTADGGTTIKPPVVEPPIVEPPTVEPPVVEPPVVEPPPVVPPVVVPPVVVPPVVEPPVVKPPVVPPVVVPPVVKPPVVPPVVVPPVVTPPPSSKVVPLTSGAPSEPVYTSTSTTPRETWLGGTFSHKINPMATIANRGNTQMNQENAAISALQRASGVAPTVNAGADYYSYGNAPDIAATLSPYKTGGAVQKYANGGKIMASPLMAATGGDVEHKGSHYVQGAGGGQDDLINAKLADGEYVFDADIVAALGDGSNKEGARRLDEMREAIRAHKRSAPVHKIPPKAKHPLAYLKGIK